MYFQNALAFARKRAPRVDVAREAGLTRATYLPFNAYPMADYLRLAVAVARHGWPELPIGEGLRRIGHQAYDTFLDSHLGKVVFGAFGRAFHLIAKHGDKGWALSINFGRIAVEELGPRHFRYHFSDMPIFLETHQVGAVEGAMKATGVTGEVLVEPRELSSLSMDLVWQE